MFRQVALQLCYIAIQTCANAKEKRASTNIVPMFEKKCDQGSGFFVIKIEKKV